MVIRKDESILSGENHHDREQHLVVDKRVGGGPLVE
jgi:hypothetical protein